VHGPNTREKRRGGAHARRRPQNLGDLTFSRHLPRASFEDTDASEDRLTKPVARPGRSRRALLRRGSAIVGLVPASLALFAAVALGSPAGDLDRSFDGDGKTLLTSPYRANEVLTQADGKILVVGTGGSTNDFTVTRLRSNGGIDTSYGTNGTASADFGERDMAHAAALQADGKLVVAGSSDTTERNALAVARFDANGKLDPTFSPGGTDGDGKKLIDSLVGERQFDAIEVLVQSDGRLVLVGGGYQDNWDVGITRLTAAGEADGTTWERFDYDDAQVTPYDAALTPDGKIVVAATRHPELAPRQIAVARFEGDGRLDKTFGGTGKVTFTSESRDEAAGVVVQRDGKIVVAGTASTTDARMVVTRFNQNGTPDRSWDGDGRAFAGFESQSFATDVALQPDGKVIAVGVEAAGIDMAAARFNANGSLDSRFGSGGRTAVDYGFAEVADTVTVQSDGRILLAGQAAGGAPIARLLADPPLANGGQPGGTPAGDPHLAPDREPGVTASVPRCAGERATIVGTERGETLRGTRRADVIVARGGKDRVRALGGQDIVCGGKGRDTLFGGRGRDRLIGGGQRDRCTGGSGRDRAADCEVRRSL
jgi:uncharacterized delta-60 repeat protein